MSSREHRWPVGGGAMDAARLLVVDSDVEMCDYLQRVLQLLGTVEVATDGREALAAIEARPPDVVVSDLPGLDRTDFVRALRGNAKTKAIPIVMLSANARAESPASGVNLVDDYIVKPFSARELVARVQSQLLLARQRTTYTEALVESDERFRALVTATSDVVYRMNPDWTEMRFLVGRDFIPTMDDPNRPWLDKYIHSDEQSHVVAAIREAVRTKSVFELEHRVLRVDGSLAWTFSRAVPMLDSTGEIVEWFGATRDITPRKEAEAALRASEDRYRTLFETIDEGFCVIEMIYDEASRPIDYRFVEVNPAFEKHTGLVGALGRTIREMVPTQEQHWFDAYDKVVRTGEPTRFQNRGEGMERWFDVYANRVGPQDDRRVAVLFTDITERRLAEEALRLSERRFAAFFSQSAVAMSIVRFDNETYVEVNEKWTELFGYSRHEVVGQRALELSVPQHDQLFARLRSHGALRDVELVMTKRSGEQVVGLLSAQVIDVAGDRVIASSFLDITDRKRAEQALVDADRRKDEFLAVLSHELRNPLAPISNGLYILDHAAPGSEQAARAKRIIGRQVTQLSNLVNDLLDVTRIVSGKVQLQMMRLDLNEVVRRAVEDNRSQFDQANVKLTVHLDARPVFVQADHTRVSQIVGNLLSNSAKFTQEGGHTRVSVAALGHDATVSVVDDGVGIAPEMLGHVFEPFSQAEQTLDRSKGGLGLGLALVKALVELHGGSVEARSAGAGCGTELSLRIPLDAAAIVEAATPATNAAASRKRVLIIEDNVDAADTLGELLAIQNNDVSIAYDGAAGLERAREFRPDVVLCDIGLPGMDGYDVARAVRADDAIARAYLVAVSGYARPEDLSRATDAGFDSHLAKPVNLDKLMRLLATIR